MRSFKRVKLRRRFEEIEEFENSNTIRYKNVIRPKEYLNKNRNQMRLKRNKMAKKSMGFDAIHPLVLKNCKFSSVKPNLYRSQYGSPNF